MARASSRSRARASVLVELARSDDLAHIQDHDESVVQSAHSTHIFLGQSACKLLRWGDLVCVDGKYLTDPVDDSTYVFPLSLDDDNRRVRGMFGLFQS